jgi:hypothetical protein
MIAYSHLNLQTSADYSLRTVSLTRPEICPALSIESVVDTNDAKAYIAYIRNVERHVRSSYEYREYVKYLKESMNQSHCVFLRNVSYKNKSASIELHHCPLTLWDVVDLHIRRALDVDATVRTFEIVERVLLDHQQNRIGLVPLSKTVHELVHDGSVFVPLNFVYGDWRSFVAEHDKYITPAQKQVLATMERLTREFNDNPDPHKIPQVLAVRASVFEYAAGGDVDEHSEQ